RRYGYSFGPRKHRRSNRSQVPSNSRTFTNRRQSQLGQDASCSHQPLTSAFRYDTIPPMTSLRTSLSALREAGIVTPRAPRVGAGFVAIIAVLGIGSFLLDKRSAVEAAGAQAPMFEVDPMWPK